jgi:hypothetical protein
MVPDSRLQKAGAANAALPIPCRKTPSAWRGAFETSTEKWRKFVLAAFLYARYKQACGPFALAAASGWL